MFLKFHFYFFILLSCSRVMRSPQCQMDQNNLARVFGPTVVGHGMSEPTPSTIMRDTNTQPKVPHQQMAHFKKLFFQQDDIKESASPARWCAVCCPSPSLTGGVSSLIRFHPLPPPPLLAPTTRMVDMVGFGHFLELFCCAAFERSRALFNQ